MHNLRGLILLFVVLGWFSLSSLALAEPLHHISSETCKTCHKEIYKQWKGSMHGNSSALNDPIHATFYKKVVGDPTKEGVKHKASGKYPVCLQCHAPNAAKDKTTKLDAKPAYAEGVNCVVCHTLKKYNGIQAPNGKLQLGLKAYDYSKDTVQGPGRHSNVGLQKLTAAGDVFGGSGMSDDSKPNPHLGEGVTVDGVEIPSIPMESNPKLMKTSDACMGCHDQRNNPHGVPLCQTGNEYSISHSQVNCLSCHMPINDGLADHSMGGGHDSGILQRSVVFDVSTESMGDVIRATAYLKNPQPHSLPTGAPFRNIYMKLTAYDGEGNVVWENAKGHPKDGDSKAYFVYALADSEGKPAMPPTATALGKDSRLKPHEERTLVYDIPSKGVKLVRGELYYNLLWPVLVEKFKHLPEDLTAPTLIATAESSI
ncbi:MAG: cytochrome c family protein [Candidatus Thiodiazotropha taylori]|nr:cytochrome c family protein [Candidatus Thiodiazotropha taylori]RLW53088.1 MAG: cytochrome c family protein [gamma proteobacterium symbiont of Stewartia floridana]MCG7943616.1 cytochrome c family protein [Candidatus Thiodiazotropha taylori]MCG7960899.1 cytochrome c family protein [Candidatus Thiodiazotropha taylori]MCG8070989.1 cytochrome c family protein [Candidatus Thiodiazotropha taylori]